MKRITLSAFTLMLVIGIVGAGTFAWFTDTQTTSASTFTAGILELDSGGFASFDFDIPHMAPGDVTAPVSITIKNSGDIPLGWFAQWEISGGEKLREAIYIESAKMEFLDINGTPGIWEPTDAFITNGVGSGPYPGWYNVLATNSGFGVVTLDAWDGNSAMGSAPYEHMGAMKPDYAYRLTVTFGFREEAGNEYQGDVTNPVSVAIKVDATQVNEGAVAELGPTWASASLVSWMNQQLAKQQ